MSSQDFEGRNKAYKKICNVLEDMAVAEEVRDYYRDYMTDSDIKNIRASSSSSGKDPLSRTKFKIIHET